MHAEIYLKVFSKYHFATFCHSFLLPVCIFNMLISIVILTSVITLIFFPDFNFIPFTQRTSSTMFPCDSCDRKYTRKDNLRRHKKFECGKEPQFYCSHCPYRAKYKGTLQVHIALKHSSLC